MLCPLRCCKISLLVIVKDSTESHRFNSYHMCQTAEIHSEWLKGSEINRFWSLLSHRQTYSVFIIYLLNHLCSFAQRFSKNCEIDSSKSICKFCVHPLIFLALDQTQYIFGMSPQLSKLHGQHELNQTLFVCVRSIA